jgi:hypothetical protein
VPMPNSNRPPVGTDMPCAYHAVSTVGRNGLARTNVPTRKSVVAAAAKANVGIGDGSCMPSSIKTLQ